MATCDLMDFGGTMAAGLSGGAYHHEHAFIFHKSIELLIGMLLLAGKISSTKKIFIFVVQGLNQVILGATCSQWKSYGMADKGQEVGYSLVW